MRATVRLGWRVASAVAFGATAALAVTLTRGAPMHAALISVSGAACTLSGYPEVAAYRGDGAQVGNAAGWDTSVAARRILLAPGATAHAAVTASVSAGPCRPAAATGLRVAPPGQPAARYVPHALRACSAVGPRAPVYLRVRAVQPGAGAAAAPNRLVRPVSAPRLSGDNGEHERQRDRDRVRRLAT